jgi:hypothetical protein
LRFFGLKPFHLATLLGGRPIQLTLISSKVLHWLTWGQCYDHKFWLFFCAFRQIIFHFLEINRMMLPWRRVLMVSSPPVIKI